MWGIYIEHYFTKKKQNKRWPPPWQEQSLTPCHIRRGPVPAEVSHVGLDFRIAGKVTPFLIQQKHLVYVFET